MSASLPSRRRAESCLSDLVLDRLRTGELEGAQANAARSHLETCTLCSARLGELAQEDERFAKEVWIQGEALRAKRRMPAFGWVASAAAAAAAVLIVARPWTLNPNLTKGGESLALVVRHPDGRTEDVLPGQSLSPGDAVRMVVTAREASAALVILDLDGRGTVSPFEPLQGPPKHVGTGRQILEGSVVLDDALGPERLVALFCGAEISVSDALDAGRRALAAAGGDPRAVHAIGLPCREASILIQKEARP